MTQTKYESGATTHAVNDLILFTDNTRELAELRDALFMCHLKFRNHQSVFNARPLLHYAVDAYIKEFPSYSSHKHILLANWTNAQIAEFERLYAEDFEIWKKENGH